MDLFNKLLASNYIIANIFISYHNIKVIVVGQRSRPIALIFQLNHSLVYKLDPLNFIEMFYLLPIYMV